MADNEFDTLISQTEMYITLPLFNAYNLEFTFGCISPWTRSLHDGYVLVSIITSHPYDVFDTKIPSRFESPICADGHTACIDAVHFRTMFQRAMTSGIGERERETLRDRGERTAN